MKLLFNIIKIAIILFAFYMAMMIITDYRPKDIMDLSIEKNATLHKISRGKVLSAITYNIGYCGIDKDQDVFIDGGHGAGSESKEKTLENLKDRKSTRLNSSHANISYAVFCLKK